MQNEFNEFVNSSLLNSIMSKIETNGPPLLSSGLKKFHMESEIRESLKNEKKLFL